MLVNRLDQSFLRSARNRRVKGGHWFLEYISGGPKKTFRTLTSNISASRYLMTFKFGSFIVQKDLHKCAKLRFDWSSNILLLKTFLFHVKNCNIQIAVIYVNFNWNTDLAFIIFYRIYAARIRFLVHNQLQGCILNMKTRYLALKRCKAVIGC